jgi:hypothetical protein
MTGQRDRVVIVGRGFGGRRVTCAPAQAVEITMGVTLEQAYDEIIHDEHRPLADARPQQPLIPAPRRTQGPEADREVVQ